MPGRWSPRGAEDAGAAANAVYPVRRRGIAAVITGGRWSLVNLSDAPSVAGAVVSVRVQV
jgi:hypothetical protein